MVPSFTHQGVDLSFAIVNTTAPLPGQDSTHKVGTTECSGDENGYPSTIWSLNADITTDMREYFFVAHSLQCQFAPIAVSGD